MNSNIWYTFCPVCCVSHVALGKGFFEDEFARDGVELSHISALPIEEWRVHFSHEHPSLFRDGGNVPPIWTRSEGVDTKVIGITWCHAGQAILVAKDSPIKSVTELKGKRIALLRRLPSVIDFGRAAEKRGIIMSLRAHDLTEDDITFIDLPIDIPNVATNKEMVASGGWALGAKTGWTIPQQPEVEALQQREVDAIFSFAGREALLEELGLARIIYSLDKHPDWKYSVNLNLPFVCTVSGSFAREHPDLVVRWMKVMVKAGMWAKENYSEVVTIMSKATYIAEELIKKTCPPDFHKHLVPEISDRGIEALEIQKKFLREHGFINSDFDLSSWIDSSFLDASLKEL